MAPERRDLPSAWWAIQELRRRVDDVERWVGKYGPIIEGLVKADEIADAVAKKMGEQQLVGFTKVQRRVAYAGVVVAFGVLLTDVVSRFVG